MFFRTLTLTAAMALGLSAGTVSAEVETEIIDFAFPFEGPFGSFDTNQLQRGLQIFTEYCSSCHGINRVAFRTLSGEGGPAIAEDQMRAYAEGIDVFDQTLADGTGDFRPATPADYFPSGSYPGAPDLSLMAKARAGFSGPYGTGLSQLVNGMGGAEYVASLIAGYEDPPACAPADFAGYYNKAFANGGFPEECIDDKGHHAVPGSWIAMPQPLYGEDTTFLDEHSNDLESEAQDVAAFLMWTAEPHLVARKQAGLTGVIFLALLAGLLYLTSKRLWAPHKHPRGA